jgi:hypothetical protein
MKRKAHSHLTVQVHPTVQQTILPEDDPAGSKHIGVFYEYRFMYFGALIGGYYFWTNTNVSS